jgi:RimJ/RimL family protein N-acetyltransferase
MGVEGMGDSGIVPMNPDIISRGIPMAVEQVRDREELRDFLMRDRLASAYLLGNLDPAYFQWCKAYGAREDDGSLESVVLLYTGLSLPAVFTAGDERHFGELLEAIRNELPERFHFHVQEKQLAALHGVYEPSESKRMWRMGLERQSYIQQTSDGVPYVERLGHRDTAAIMELYQHYPDNLFEAYQLETGFYFGVRDEDLGLASIAGIHVFSEEHDVAVIGNFVTHPERRGNGLASACTARLLDELFEQVSFVALNVQADNAAAIHMYGKFGFEKNNIFFEGIVD